MIFFDFDLIYLVFCIVSGCIALFLLVLCSLNMLRFFQLSNYRQKEFFNFIKQGKYTFLKRLVFLAFFSALTMVIFWLTFESTGQWVYLGFLFFIVLSMLFYKVNKKAQNQKLYFSNRLKRQLTILSCLNAIFISVVFLLIPFEWAYIFLVVGQILIIPSVVLSGLITSPIENLIKKKFIKKAQDKLAQNPKLKIIGITGSYGKTTTKNILNHILSTKYKVCASPKNYNTPMGVCRTINENLSPQDEILILELGARYRHDIKELLNITMLDYAVLTSVGECHIETFGSMSNIIDTKTDIVSGLKNGTKNSLAVVDSTDKRVVDKLTSNDNIDRVVFVNSDDDLFGATNIISNQHGTEFILKINNQLHQCTTKLLGNHIPKLIALATVIACDLNIDKNSLIDSIATTPSVQHRLELMDSADSNTIVIDDSYNANMQGILNALQILNNYKEYKKIIITPGVVELGSKSQEINVQVGCEIAKVCDYAFLIGNNSGFIKQGIEQCINSNGRGSDVDNKVVVKLLSTRELAVQELKNIKDKKVVLFCNDLPDNMQ